MAAATLSSTQAFADSPKWDFLELSISDTNPQGFNFLASKLVTDNVFVTGEFNKFSDNVLGVDVDLDTLVLCAGYKHSLTENTDWYGSMSYVDMNGVTSGFGFKRGIDHNGFGIGTGVRSMLTDQFELSGHFTYSEIDDESATGFAVNALYYLTEQVGLNAIYSYTLDTNEDSIGIGARFTF